jgi:outer membrane lipoprotein-sorting protein
MNIAMKTALSTFLIVLSVGEVAVAQAGYALPTADEVVGKMIRLDDQRHAQLQGYTATRQYVAVNKRRRAEMLVRVACASDGVKQFTILSEDGSHSIRKHVFYKMLNEEVAASRRGTRESTRITPANYDFQVVGQDAVDGRPAYVLSVTPKAQNKYLIDGKIWVDATDYSIVRIEGRPARNPSFWTRSVHFVHTYQKVGPFWLAASTDSVSEIRIFGTAELKIENSGYTLNSPDIQTTDADTDTEARLAQ